MDSNQPNAIRVSNIISKGENLNNMTSKLSFHVKVSGNCYSFVKQRVHKEEGKNKRGQQTGCGNNKKELECKDPTVYFNLIIFPDVDPTKIIAQTTYKWTCINRQHMQIKDLQDVASEMVVTFFKLSTETSKAVILAKLSKMMATTQTMAV
jgi:hypothetical protein